MVTHEELHELARTTYRTEPGVLHFLEKSPPPSGDTSPEAMLWYSAWATVLLMDLRASDELITWDAAAQIIRLPDASLMGQVIDLVRQTDALRRTDAVEPIILTDADFARIFKAH